MSVIYENQSDTDGSITNNRKHAEACTCTVHVLYERSECGVVMLTSSTTIKASTLHAAALQLCILTTHWLNTVSSAVEFKRILQQSHHSPPSLSSSVVCRPRCMPHLAWASRQ